MRLLSSNRCDHQTGLVIPGILATFSIDGLISNSPDKLGRISEDYQKYERSEFLKSEFKRLEEDLAKVTKVSDLLVHMKSLVALIDDNSDQLPCVDLDVGALLSEQLKRIEPVLGFVSKSSLENLDLPKEILEQGVVDGDATGRLEIVLEDLVRWKSLMELIIKPERSLEETNLLIGRLSELMEQELTSVKIPTGDAALERVERTSDLWEIDQMLISLLKRAGNRGVALPHALAFVSALEKMRFDLHYPDYVDHRQLALLLIGFGRGEKQFDEAMGMSTEDSKEQLVIAIEKVQDELRGIIKEDQKANVLNTLCSKLKDGISGKKPRIDQELIKRFRFIYNLKDWDTKVLEMKFPVVNSHLDVWKIVESIITRTTTIRTKTTHFFGVYKETQELSQDSVWGRSHCGGERRLGGQVEEADRSRRFLTLDEQADIAVKLLDHQAKSARTAESRTEMTTSFFEESSNQTRSTEENQESAPIKKTFTPINVKVQVKPSISDALSEPPKGILVRTPKGILVRTELSVPIADYSRATNHEETTEL